MLELVAYSDKWREPWEAFLAGRTKNATLLHTRQFLSHQPLNETEDASLLFVEKGRVVAVCPAAAVKEEKGTVWVSHPRATYGGFVLSEELGVADALEMVALAIEYASQAGHRALIVRNPFRIFQSCPADELDYALWKNGFRVDSRMVEIAIPLQGVSADDLLGTYEHNARNQVRKALKSGLRFAVTDRYADFWAILETQLREKHGVRPTHDLATFERLRSRLDGGQVSLLGAFLEERLVAGTVLFRINAFSLHAQYIAAQPEHSALCPTNGLIHHAALQAIAAGCHYFNLGTANFDGGRGVNSSLFKFKESFGGRGVLRETMRLDLPPRP